MIIYGTKAKVLLTEAVNDSCPNCNTHNLYMNVLQKWAHIFWIPTFPIGKTGVSQCTHCQQTLQLKQMPPSLKLSYDNLKLQTKTPVWTFSGIVVIAGIFIFATIHGKQNAERITKLIPALQKNDVLHLKLTDNAYSLSKVTRINRDTVFFVNNKYQTDRASGLNDLKTKEYDTEERFLTVADLKAMNSKDEVLDIDRD
ncbi:hypothetical protein [Mucilaginibacter pedocola]|uniref:Zinc-ribbon 15 domain-containing protein n=1 Tax=Mucilaginibacter pedocola TaxID=1792845 RepID=A0A1S9PMF2_9SPHI|nr:hypothetical protein [Mucilaginibacter pedocola]OOQ62132.1 hypothetical protein BC343_03520 [Mucilaginibacter pedocola]